ncbi:MAG: N-acetylmuramoyl-L-alanine amidase [Bacteroidia bacterium]|nr:N-acetylmuramoyl-L-alanine amidase [Bacteroidia bacterium]
MNYKKPASIFAFAITVYLLLFLLTTVDAIAQDTNYVTFTAKGGDGIYKILHENGLTDPSCFNNFVGLNKNNLGKNNALIIGKKYKLPGQTTLPPDTTQKTEPVSLSEKMIVEPLFGKSLEHVEIVDQQLSGAVFYLVSGHGGPDPGAMGKIGKNILCEDEYAYDVTLRFGRELLRHAAKVYFIVRDPNDGIRNELYLKNSKDEVCYPDIEIPLNQVERLKQRVDAINTLYRNETPGTYKRCIEIHVDARDTKKNIDIFFYYHERSKNGERLASTMRNSIERKYQLKQPGRGYSGDVSTRSLYMLEKTMPTAVFIELGNINHARDQQRLIYENNRQALARWMCDGVMEDFKKSK